MNIKEYISSGIIESYTLGLASPDEQREFELLCLEYPELQTARIEFEIDLERIARASAAAPPADLKAKVLAGVRQSSGKVLSMPAARENQGNEGRAAMPWMRYLVAASVILLVASTIMNFYFYSQYRNSLATLERYVSEQDRLVKQNQVMQTSLAMIKDPSMAYVAMKGQKVDPAALADVYWDTKSKDVYLLVRRLPQPATDKQYQLWAIVDGKPVDAGVFDMSNAEALVKMKNIPRAQAFAITLEKKGGSASPDLAALYVMGQI